MTYEEELARRSEAMVRGFSHFGGDRGRAGGVTKKVTAINATTIPEVRRVPCPRCGAGAGKPCVNSNGVGRKANHIERVRARVAAVVDG